MNFVIGIITQLNFNVNREHEIKFQEGGLQMTFGEKIKMLRAQKGLSAEDLARKLGVSVRTISSYETGSSYPRRHDFYNRLAEVLGTDVNYLRTEDEEFMAEVGQEYGTRGQLQYARALAEVKKLFAGGELPPEDEIAFIQDVQQIYLDSKKRAKKFTPKKYLDQQPDDEQ